MHLIKSEIVRYRNVLLKPYYISMHYNSQGFKRLTACIHLYKGTQARIN